ncbi:MAG: chloride channel protein [Synechococcus sp.]|nr:chloride channel protein [Synechococcus sp.]
MRSNPWLLALRSALIGAMAGSLGAGLMALIHWGTERSWGPAVLAGFPSSAPLAQQLLVPLLAGLAIGLLRRSGAQPLPELHQTLQDLHSSSQAKALQLRVDHLLLGLLALVGGGTLGPEALLSRGLAELSRTLSRWPEQALSAISGSLGLFGLPLVGGVAVVERSGQPLPSKLWRWLPGVSSGIAGFAAFQGFSSLGSGETSVPYQWPSSGMQLLSHLLWALLLGLLGGGLGLLFVRWRSSASALLRHWRLSPLAQAMLTGAVIAAVGQWQPLALFSGELQITPLLQGTLELSGAALLLLGFTKLALCGLCLSSGWIGGQFFPLIFGAAAIGQGLALCWPHWIPAQIAVSSLVAAIQSAVLGQALLPLLLTAGVLKGHAISGVLVGSVMGLAVRQITQPAEID